MTGTMMCIRSSNHPGEALGSAGAPAAARPHDTLSVGLPPEIGEGVWSPWRGGLIWG